jgi:lambda repressor-like predicted transcriptional regulator
MWISKATLLRKSGILGANSTRNNQLLQQALENLLEQEYLLQAEIVSKPGQKQDAVRIIPNPEKICRSFLT